MSVRYACSHLDTPTPPLPPSYPSSRPSFFPIEQLYFCEECDAVRCDLCVGVEVASYFCPNCLFDVPGANVRGDKNRWVGFSAAVCLLVFLRPDLVLPFFKKKKPDARDHVSPALNAHRVYRSKRPILPRKAVVVMSLEMGQCRLDLSTSSFVLDVGGRVSR